MTDISQLPGLADNRWSYNAAGWEQDRVTTQGSRQWAVWWDNDGHPLVATRTLGSDDWAVRDLHHLPGNPLASPVAEDNHNALSVAVDAQDRVHVAGNMHNDEMRYVRTVDGIDGEWTADGKPGGGDTNISYPKFVRVGSRLFVFYRAGGGAGNADTYFEEWDGADWVGRTKLIDGQESGHSPYLFRIAVDGSDVHVGWVWRRTTNPDTNSDICHIVSRNAGASWETQAGQQLDVPVTKATGPVAVAIAEGEGLTGNSAGLDVDQGTPHIVTRIDSDPSRVVYATWDGTWSDTLLFDDWTHQSSDGSIARPGVVAHQGRVWVIWRNNVDAPGKIMLREITGGLDGDDTVILDQDLGIWDVTVDSRSLPTIVLLATYVGLPDQPLSVVTFDLDEEAEQPTTGLTPIAVAQTATDVDWLACDLASGRIITDLPDVSGTISRLISTHTTAALTIPIGRIGPRDATLSQRAALARRATVKGRTMIVAVVNDVPSWAGWVVDRDAGTGADVAVSCDTLESYLDRRYVADHDLVDVDQAAIAAALARDAGDVDGLGSGIGLLVDAPPTGIMRTRRYLASDHATVYERLSELSAVRDGIEWTIDLDWVDIDHTAVAKILRIRSRLGEASDVPHIFEDVPVRLRESWRAGHAANVVVAYGAGEGDDQPVSTPAVDQAALDAGSPIVERRWQPSSSVTSQDVLDDHAGAELARRREGARTVRLTAPWNRYPRLGVDWRLGDDVAWEVRGDFYPDGIVGRGRAVGWELDLAAGTLAPIVEVDEVTVRPAPRVEVVPLGALLTEDGQMLLTEDDEPILVEA